VEPWQRSRATQRRASARSTALEILHRIRAVRTQPDPELTAALSAARIAVIDVMLFGRRL
jgi:hypothetical protein